jgi:hypothetical protein
MLTDMTERRLRDLARAAMIVAIIAGTGFFLFYALLYVLALTGLWLP